jgi:cyclophilin family peptidyl-prolyl cis-trans isomerase
MRNRLLPIALGAVVLAMIAGAILVMRGNTDGATAAPPPSAPVAAAIPSPVLAPKAAPIAEPSPLASVAQAVPSAAPSADASPAAVAAFPSSNPSPDLSVDSMGLSKAAVVLVTTQGTVKFHLYPKDAPLTVARVIELVSKGFYNGTIFHRAIPDFLVQGGDPLGNGTGGSGLKLKGEFSERLHHLDGSVAMARGSDPNSADSQFYFTIGSQPHLDGRYAIFGQVYEGMDVVRKLRVGDKIISMTVE